MSVTNRVGAAARLVAGSLSGRPVLVGATLYPTARCNLRCAYCSSPYRTTGELSTEQWRGVIDELAELGCRRIAILGGEPLLRPDVPDLVDHIGARGLSSVLTSNGLLVPKHAKRLRGLGTLVLSLDAPGPANDAVRGKGVFAAVQHAIAAAKTEGIPVKLNAVLSAPTAPFLDDLLAFAEAHDLHLTVNVMRSGTSGLWHEAAAIRSEDAAIAALLRRLAELARTNPLLLLSPATYRYAAAWGDYGRDRFERDELATSDPRLREGPTCQAGRAYLSIDADGTVYPCCTTMEQLPGGNVLRDGVAAAWRSLHDQPCIACFSPTLVEKNSLLSLHPSVLVRFARRHLPRFA